MKKSCPCCKCVFTAFVLTLVVGALLCAPENVQAQAPRASLSNHPILQRPLQPSNVSPPHWGRPFFAGIQLKRSIHEEQLLAILFIDVCERDHFEEAIRGTVPLPV